MKTISDGKNVIRAKDEDARFLVSTGKWIFVPKATWKKFVRKLEGGENVGH
jgi:hypothetical protein